MIFLVFFGLFYSGELHAQLVSAEISRKNSVCKASPVRKCRASGFSSWTSGFCPGGQVKFLGKILMNFKLHKYFLWVGENNYQASKL